MKLARFAVSQPVLMNLMAATMVIYGALVMQDMVRESHPVVPTGWCRIATVVPGASAEEVEQLVTAPLERGVGGVDTIEQMFSTSREGLSTIFIQFDPDIEDVGREVIEISNLAGRVELPSVAEDTDVAEFKISIPTMAVAIRGTASEAVLREVGLDVAETVESIDGIAGTGRFGIRDREIRVEVSADRSAGYGVPITAVADALSSRAFNIPAGTIESPGDIRLIRGMTRAADAETIRSVVVRPDPTGGAVHVGDVADVYDGFAEARIAGRVNGEEGMVLILRKSEGADSIAISAAVREAVDRLRGNLPAGVSIDIFGDASHEVNRSLGALYDNAAMGLVLVLALLWFFVGGRNATMAALGLPVALAGAIAAMAMMGITINMISLLALILCLGVVVDDAIIIIENIYRHMEEGMPRKQAAIVGMSEVFWPVVSSTLTTCAAFLPMLLMTGVLGKFFSIIPKVVIVSLAASLIEAMLVLPSHMADFGKVTKRKGKRDTDADDADADADVDADAPGAPDAVATPTRARPETRWERIGRRTMATYERFLRGSLRRRWAVIVVAYGVTGGLVYLTATQKDVVLFTDGDVDMFDVRIEMPTEATRDQTSAVVNEVERRILALDNDDVEATVGVRGLTRNNMGVLHGDNMGMVTVYVVPGETRSSLHAGRDLLSACNSLFDDIVGPSSIEIIEHRPGPPRGDPVAVRVFGENLERLVELNEAIQVELQRIPGVTTIRDNFELGRREVQVFVDEERAAMHGLTPPMVTAWLARAFGSTPAATTREGRDEIDVVVRLNEESRRDPARIAMLNVPTPDGSQVSLRDIADVRDGRGPQLIQRRDERRMVATYAQIDDAVTNSQAVNRELQGRIASLIAANPDVEFAYGGQYEETNKSLNSLKQSFVLALLLIYTILATQFRSFGQPFVVMAAIPLSFIGVTIGFLVTDTPVGLIALIGVVGLAGIVVNDSLVLVDFINQRRRQGVALGEAVVAASKLRLRPIFLTSITTVAGLFPLAISGAEAPMLSPMASAMAWGLSFATFLTLVLIPCLYMGYADIARFMSRVFGPLARWVTDPGDAAPEPEPEMPASAE